MDSPALASTISDINKLRELYKEKGVQYTIVQALSKINKGLRFSDIKLIYEAIKGRRISNGTVGDLLKRLLKKGI